MYPPGPPDPQAQAPITTNADEDPRTTLNPIQLTPEQIGEWWTRIEDAKKRREQQEKRWEILLKEYLPVVQASGSPEAVKVNAHFRNVHTKIGQLFVRQPDVQLTPKGPALSPVMIPDPMTGLPKPATPEEVIPIKQAVINYYFGKDKINGTRLMDECLFDILAWAGFCCVKVGYTRTTQIYNQPRMQPDPAFVAPPAMPGSLEGLAPTPQAPMVPVTDPLTGQPVTDPVPVPIHEEWYATRYSPKKALLDADLRSTRVDEHASWVGMEWFLPKRQVLREFGLTEDDLGAGATDDRVFEHEDAKPTSKRDLVHGYELYYKASIFTDTRHPQAIHQLTLIEGLRDTTAVSRPSPDQTFDQFGKLTDDSLVGFPLKFGYLRDLADSPYPPADSAFTNSGVKELNTFRRQGVKLRDAAIGKILYDQGAFDEADVSALQESEHLWIGVKEGLLAQGADKVLTQTQKITGNQDDYRTQTVLKADMDETLGISAAQAGAPLDTVRSATEVQTFSAAAAGRQEKEQNRAIEFYIGIVRAVDTLLQRYAQGDDYVAIVGEDGSRKLAMWNRQIIGGTYSYDIKPDSQLSIDAARDRQQLIAVYNIIAKDPLVNRVPILRRIATAFGFDPFKLIADPVTMQTQMPYGGPANKHASEQSGQQPNAPGAADSDDNRQERNPRPGGGA